MPEPVKETTTEQAPRSTAGGSGSSSIGRSVQLKAALIGQDYDTQVQMLAPEGPGPGDVHAAAAKGISGSGGALPHKDTIQNSFGGYDISNVAAHTDAAASQGAAAMGANAYATGNHVVLGKGGGDLHTTAHEAAHVIQQRAGVSLSGGVGAAGDAYEQHADKVADAVVAGKSAEPILAEMAGSGGGGGVQQRVVQRDEKDPKKDETKKPDKDDAKIKETVETKDTAKDETKTTDKTEVKPTEELSWDDKRAIEESVKTSIRAFSERADQIRTGVASGFTQATRDLLKAAEEAIAKFTWDNNERKYHQGRLDSAKNQTLIAGAQSELRSCAGTLESMVVVSNLKPAEHYQELAVLLNVYEAATTWTEKDQRRLERLDGAAALYEKLVSYPTMMPSTVQEIDAAVTAFLALAAELTTVVPDGDDWPRLVNRASEIRRRIASDIAYRFPWDSNGLKIPLADVESHAMRLDVGKRAFDRLTSGFDRIALKEPVPFEAWTTWQTSTLPAVRALALIMTPWQSTLDEVSPEAGLNQAEKVDDTFIGRLTGVPEAAHAESKKLPFGLGPQFEHDVYKPERRTREIERVRTTNTKFQEAEPSRLAELTTETGLSIAEIEQEKMAALQTVYGLAIPGWVKIKAELAAIADWKKTKKGRELTAEEEDFLKIKMSRINGTRFTLMTPAAMFQELLMHIGEETLTLDKDAKGKGKENAGKNAGTAGTGLALTNAAENALQLGNYIPDLPAAGSTAGLQIFGRYIQRRGQGWDATSAAGSAMGEALVRTVAFFLLPTSLKVLFGVASLGGTVKIALANRSEGRQNEEDAATMSARLQTLLALKKEYEKEDFEPLAALTSAVADYTQRLEAIQKAGGKA